MATTITMPQLGETVTEGTVERWLKKPGDAVEKYEAFVEVSTDKVNSEVPAPVTGTIRELLVQEGQTVATGTPIAVIDDVAAAGAPAPKTQDAPAQTSAPSTVEDMAHSAREEPVPGFNIPQAPTKPASSNGSGARAPGAAPDESSLHGASPAVRRLAREHRVDVRAIRGTGANGRVTATDVLAAASMGPAAAVGQAIAVGTNFGAAPPPSGTSTYGAPIPGTIVPLSGARRIIAERMVESKHTAPHAWSTVEIDVTNVWKWREREKGRFEQEHGAKLTMLPFFIRAVVESLAVFPLMNARFAENGIHVHKDMNVGIAIGLPTNLVVPVIRNANTLSIKGLAIAAADLIDRARKNKLTTDDLKDGTFTVNNNGANGSILSAPIINGGQAGIVTMEAVVKRPVVLPGDAIAIRSMMNSCLSLDHRVVDGTVASGFLADLKKRLEAMGPSGTL